MPTTPFLRGPRSSLAAVFVPVLALAAPAISTVVLAAPAPHPCDEHTAQASGANSRQQSSQHSVRHETIRSTTPGTFTATAMAVIDDVPAPDGTTSPMRIEVRVENGKVSAEVDGAAVSADRIVVEEGRVVILGQDGKPLRELPMMKVEPSGAIELVFETVDAIRRRVGDIATWSFDAADGDALQAVVRARALDEAARAGAYARRFFGDLELDIVVDAPTNTSSIGLRPAPKSMIGVSLAEPEPSLLHHLKLAPGEVTMLTAIVPDLPAAKAGLEPFDIVVAVDGRSPSGPEQIRSALADREPGDVVRFSVLRAGERREVDVTLVAFDPAKHGAMPVGERWVIGRSADGAPVLGPEPSAPAGSGAQRGVASPSARVRGEFLPRVLEVAPLPGGGERFLYQIDRGAGAGPGTGPATGTGAGPGADGGERSPARRPGGPPAQSGDDATAEARLERLEARLDELTRALERLVEKMGR